MKNIPKLIVMLTYNDMTVKNAYEIFDRCKDSKALYWGFKEEGLPPDKMKELYSYMKECGMTTVLEVVAYTEDECLNGAKTAVECGCDILMGTLFFESVDEYCQKHHLKYMPFVGQVKERPSVLFGSAEEMIKQANEYIKHEFVAQVNAPVCVAGSVNSYARLKEIKDCGAWAFTIGSAFFDKRFGDDIPDQINNVCEYMERRRL
ncbi:MAG: hypothetical protein KH216_05275 [Clostridiales bacterium]|nr:hypothetical protein [Clostridiales bacterium]